MNPFSALWFSSFQPPWEDWKLKARWCWLPWSWGKTYMQWIDLNQQVLLVTSSIVGLTIWPWVVSPSGSITPGPALTLIFVATNPHILGRQGGEEAVGEVVSNWGEVSLFSRRSSCLAEASWGIPRFSSGEVLITVTGMAKRRPTGFTCWKVVILLWTNT